MDATTGWTRPRRPPAVAAVMLATVLALAPTAWAQSDLPPAPDGFRWQRLEKIKGALLLPAGWHFREEEQKGTLAFFITQERIEPPAQFETGLTLNVIRSLKETKAQDYAKAFVATLVRTHERLTVWEVRTGPFGGLGARVRVRPKDGSAPVIMHVLALGNERTNALYLFIFESRESAWERAWAIGGRIMDTLVLDDEI